MITSGLTSGQVFAIHDRIWEKHFFSNEAKPHPGDAEFGRFMDQIDDRVKAAIEKCRIKEIREKPLDGLTESKRRLTRREFIQEIRDRGIRLESAHLHLGISKSLLKKRLKEKQITCADLLKLVNSHLTAAARAARKALGVSVGDASWLTGIDWSKREKEGLILPGDIRAMAGALKAADRSIAAPSELIALRQQLCLSGFECDRLLGQTENWWGNRERGAVKTPRFYLNGLRKRYYDELDSPC